MTNQQFIDFINKDSFTCDGFLFTKMKKRSLGLVKPNIPNWDSGWLVYWKVTRDGFCDHLGIWNTHDSNFEFEFASLYRTQSMKEVIEFLVDNWKSWKEYMEQ